MSPAIDLDDLYSQATRETVSVAPDLPARNKLPPIQAASQELKDLLNVQIPALLQSAIVFETGKVNARRVDGQIIGTGEADFTKGNSVYTLGYKDKTFQLIDVPGIEGDEGKYEHMVREAVAKAHLVFYVNGTNKKPEKATAAKIRSYLRRGTQVCPIVNIRGNADAYEFEEDRKSLENHGQTGAALQQTLGVLETELGKEVLLPGRCVQGLLAFSSLAISSESRSTSIHPSRESNLVLQQRNYLKSFKSSPKAMFEFSQIKAVAQVLHVKLTTFREDIIESNKIKVRELLAENISDLQQALKNHREFISKVNPEFDKCRESINGAIKSFERLMTAGRKNLWNDFFNGLTDEVDQIVAENFGDNDRITSKIKKAFKTRQDNIQEKIQTQFGELMAELQSGMSQAIVRLVQDVRRVEFQQQINIAQGGQQAEYRAIDLDMALGLKGWGSIAFSIGSYTAMGAGLGTPGGTVGIAIGAAVGAVVGVLVSAMHFFTSKEKRIRKAQAQVQEKIDEARSRVMNGLSDELNKVLVPVRNEIGGATLREVDAIYANLTRPLDLIQQQITLMVRVKNQLEKMPHGTIQAIQY